MNIYKNTDKEMEICTNTFSFRVIKNTTQECFVRSDGFKCEYHIEVNDFKTDTIIAHGLQTINNIPYILFQTLNNEIIYISIDNPKDPIKGKKEIFHIINQYQFPFDKTLKV